MAEILLALSFICFGTNHNYQFATKACIITTIKCVKEKRQTLNGESILFECLPELK